MPQQTPSINSFLIALSLSAGFASSLVFAAGEAVEEANPVANAVAESEQVAESTPSDTERQNADFVAVRVSLPDGRSFTRLEPKRSMSARYTQRNGESIGRSRQTSSGARVSIPSRSVSGGSNSSSVKVGGSSGGGGGSSSSSRGGGGGGSAAVEITKEVASEAGLEASAPKQTGGVFSFGNSSGESNEQGPNDEGSSESRDNQYQSSIPSVGAPRFDREGNATGGQRVEFHDAGMSAAVIGNRVYFNNVELVVADQAFEVITGTQLGQDSAIMESGRLGSAGSDPLSSFNSRNSSIKIELESDTVVTLMMYTESPSSLNPEREMRSWTVRIR